MALGSATGLSAASTGLAAACIVVGCTGTCACAVCAIICAPNPNPAITSTTLIQNEEKFRTASPCRNSKGKPITQKQRPEKPPSSSTNEPVVASASRPGAPWRAIFARWGEDRSSPRPRGGGTAVVRVSAVRGKTPSGPQEVSGHDFTACGKTRRFERARVYSCRKLSKINVAFRP
jgi:hypothetical protein